MTAIPLASTWAGPLGLVVFVIAYSLVILEERLQLRKSKPVTIAAGLMWIIIGIAFAQQGDTHSAEEGVRHYLLEFAEVLLFLLAAMTYVNVLEERNVFEAIRGWLVSRGFSLRTIYWLTGLLAFFISPVADNMTTALVMGVIVLAVGSHYDKFVAVGCINVVVAANAGGAFSPFGDVTTLMVWQKNVVPFAGFFHLFFPALINWLVPAVLMMFAIPAITPPALQDSVQLKRGALIAIALFIATIAGSVLMHNFLHLPPVLGMMTGLGFLKLFGYWLKITEPAILTEPQMENLPADYAPPAGYNIFSFLSRAEWDTLMFFYGVVLCVGALAMFGYLGELSQLLYTDLGATVANIAIGLLSAVIDNVPVMLAVLTMQPDMNVSQWLLVTLTAGVGGSLLSIGSAAGVALMGLARGQYTFMSHLRWTWAVALGYIASIAVHLWLNGQ
ncbi:MAG: sodium:proton antiporter NhaD [Spongiibacteraceae bacterium]